MSAVTSTRQLNNLTEFTEIRYTIPKSRYEPPIKDPHSGDLTHKKAIELLLNISPAEIANELKLKVNRYVSLKKDLKDKCLFVAIAVEIIGSLAIFPAFKATGVAAVAGGGIAGGPVVLAFVAVAIISGIAAFAAYYFFSKKITESKTDLESYLTVNRDTFKKLLEKEVAKKDLESKSFLEKITRNFSSKEKISAKDLENAAKAQGDVEFPQEILTKFFTEPAATEI